MNVYVIKKDWGSIIDNLRVGFYVEHKKGDLFYKEHDESTGRNLYYPLKGGYPIWERDYGKDNPNSYYFVDKYFELSFETDKPKDYFIDKKYSQYEIEEMLSKTISPNEVIKLYRKAYREGYLTPSMFLEKLNELVKEKTTTNGRI
jgi:hypothetical protein